LLVLDNCEHLVAACAALVDVLLQSCPELRILATSRQSLGVAGETIWRVPSLALPWPPRPRPGEPIAQFEAVRLFTERASAVSPSFSVTEENGPKIAQLCYDIDGIPLAIELAAAWVSVLSIEQIAERLDDRFRFLRGGSRTALPRHQTLRGAMDWSYGLLSDRERVLLRRLAVFEGGWTLIDAEAVCSGDGIDRPEILDLLAQLVDKSLVLADAQAVPAQYRLLETTREYARERLAESGETDRIRPRHASHFLALAERTEAELQGPRQATWLAELDRARGNLRAAQRWSIETGDAATELRLAAALWDYWWMRGSLSEGHVWIEDALSRDESGPTWARARALHAAGIFSGVRGDMVSAHARMADAVGLFREIGDLAAMVRPQCDLGTTTCFLGDIAHGLATLKQALDLALQVGHEYSIGYAHYALGVNLSSQGRLDEARPYSAESISVARAIGDARTTAHSLLELSRVTSVNGDPALSTEQATEALALFDELGESWGVFGCFISLGASAQRLSQPERAARLLGAANDIAEAIGAAPLPHWRTEFEEAERAARAELGLAAYDAARVEGAAMPLADAIAFARSGDASGSAPSAGRLAAIRQAFPELTQREMDVIALVARGYTNRQIGAELVISPGTATIHVKHILSKLGFESRAQIAAWAVRQGIAEAAAGVAG
jgi:predicted ATPase/DNA-binding CsgD family transcriptional regulator